MPMIKSTLSFNSVLKIIFNKTWIMFKEDEWELKPFVKKQIEKYYAKEITQTCPCSRIFKNWIVLPKIVFI